MVLLAVKSDKTSRGIPDAYHYPIVFSRTLNAAFAFARVTKDLFVIGILIFCSNCKFTLGGRKETQLQQGITICLHSLRFPEALRNREKLTLIFCVDVRCCVRFHIFQLVRERTLH